MKNLNIAAYCSGDFGPGKIENRIADVQQSGFTTIILWSMHIGREEIQQPYGELVFNDGNIRITDGGVFNPDNDPAIAAWPGNLARLKQNGSSVDKIFISIGGDERFVNDFRTIEFMLEHNMSDVLMMNFKTLRTAFTVDGQCVIDGIDLDNEEFVKASTITDFSEMLFDLDFEITFCPFNAPTEWQGYMQTLWDKGHHVSWWNLQCYSGGNGNLSSLQPWITALSTVVGKGQGASYLVPGLAVHGATDSYPQQCPSGKGGIFESLAAVSELGLAGGFVWTYDSIVSNTQPCSGSIPTAADYAKAIWDGLDNMPSVEEDVRQMQAKIERHELVIQFGIRVLEIHGPAAQEGETGYISVQTGGACIGAGGEYDASWQVGNWRNTMTFTPRGHLGL